MKTHLNKDLLDHPDRQAHMARQARQARQASQARQARQASWASQDRLVLMPKLGKIEDLDGIQETSAVLTPYMMASLLLPALLLNTPERKRTSAMFISS